MTTPWPTPGTSLADVLTPMPVIDEDRLAANIAPVSYTHLDVYKRQAKKGSERACPAINLLPLPPSSICAIPEIHFRFTLTNSHIPREYSSEIANMLK